MQRIYLFVISLLISVSSLFGQENEFLPRGFTDFEWQQLQQQNSPPHTDRGIGTPPPLPVRTMAEWEELQALTITWAGQFNILAQIVEHSKEEVEVLIVCSDSTNVKNYLTNNYGLDNLDNVSFLEEPFNSIWIRDYAAIPVYANDVDSLWSVDWIYNRPWRPLDDALPDAIGAYFNMPVYSTTTPPEDMVNTGGNFNSDGMGTAFASDLILEENEWGNNYGVTPKTEAEIDQIMFDYMGIERYIKMSALPYDVIHHIDMHFRLLDEETLLVGEYPEGVSDGPQIEANIQYVLNNFNSSFGTPYKVIRVPMPPDFNGTYPSTGGDYRTHTNFTFVNKTVLVPTYELQHDTVALRIFRESLPGYNVVGIDCNSIIGSLGALHCITKEVGVEDPLLIVHQALRDTVDYLDAFEVNATIKHRSGIQSATLYYTTDTLAGYQSTPMTLTDADNAVWTGYMPNTANTDEYFYYVEANANNGKTQVRPITAPDGYWNFQVEMTTSVDQITRSTTRLEPIFPNPASAITCIPVTTQYSKQATIELVDIWGRTVETIFSGQLPRGDSKHFIHADQYASGTYFVRLRTEQQTEVQKLIIGY